MHIHLSFVIAGTSGINFAIPNFRLKGWAVPQFVRVCRLYIVMTVHQDGGQSRIHDALPVNHRITGRRTNLHVISPRFDEAIGTALVLSAIVLAFSSLAERWSDRR